MMNPRARGSMSAPKEANVFWIPDTLPAVSVPKSRGIIANEGLRTKLMNHPVIKTINITITPLNFSVNPSVPRERKVKHIKSTFFSPSLSENTPPRGLAAIPAKLNRDMAVLTATTLRPYSSFKTRGSQPTKV